MANATLPDGATSLAYGAVCPDCSDALRRDVELFLAADLGDLSATLDANPGLTKAPWLAF